MGIHPNVSSFDRRQDDLGEARHGLWIWAEPVVIDRAVEIYAGALDEAGTVAMARKQCRVWRAALFEPQVVLRSAVDDLARAAAELGLPVDAPAGVDSAIVEELVDIVTGRFRSSRNALRTFSLILVSVTSRLGMARSYR